MTQPPPPPVPPARTRLRRLLPFLAWPRPGAGTLRGDLWSGAAVGLMAMPQGVAYAALAGMPPVTGIYVSILPALVAAMFGASPRVSVGPTALTCLIVGASLTGLAEPGSASWVALAAWLALLSGALQVVLGFARFGWLLNVVSAPVLMAFTQAAALLIIGSQLGALCGVPPGWRPGAGGPGIDVAAAAFGFGSLATVLLAIRWRPALPSVLIVMAASAGLSVLSGFEARGGAVVGPLPQGLPLPSWPATPDFATLRALLLPVCVLALVSFLETASSAKADHQRGGTRWDQDQDLVGQGLAKVAAGLTGGFPTSASFSRSALLLFTGAGTGWAIVASVLVVLVSLFAFTPVLRHVPQSVLAAIVVAAVLGMLRPREFARLWRFSRAEAAMATTTVVVTLVSAPHLHWGVLTGVLMSLSHFVYQRLHPRIIEVGLHRDGSLRDRQAFGLAPLAPGVIGLRMDAALDFAAAGAFERAVAERLAADHAIRHVCVFAQPINRTDATGVQTLLQVHGHLQRAGVRLHLCGLKLPVEVALARAGLIGAGGPVTTYRTEAEALRAIAGLVETPADIAAAAI